MKVKTWGALVILGSLAFSLMYVNFTQDWGRAEMIARKVDKSDFCRFEDRVLNRLDRIDGRLEEMLKNGKPDR